MYASEASQNFITFLPGTHYYTPSSLVTPFEHQILAIFRASSEKYLRCRRCRPLHLVAGSP